METADHNVVRVDESSDLRLFSQSWQLGLGVTLARVPVGY